MTISEYSPGVMEWRATPHPHLQKKELILIVWYLIFKVMVGQETINPQNNFFTNLLKMATQECKWQKNNSPLANFFFLAHIISNLDPGG